MNEHNILRNFLEDEKSEDKLRKNCKKVKDAENVKEINSNVVSLISDNAKGVSLEELEYEIYLCKSSNNHLGSLKESARSIDNDKAYSSVLREY